MSQMMKTIRQSVWDNNPILRTILGICPALAVTNLLENAIVMSLGVLFVLAMSELTVSIFSRFADKHIRIIFQMLIISWFVIIVDIGIKLMVPDIGKALGPYVGLIITNCVVMGRCEAYAQFNKPLKAFGDGVVTGISFGMILIMISSIREILGFGTLLGRPMLFMANLKIGLFAVPAGAFFVIGVMIWLYNYCYSEFGGEQHD